MFRTIALCVAALTLGCGDPTTCGAGTVLVGAACVPADEACGEGTVLVGAACVPADEACGEGTVLVGSECVPADEACGEGTVLVGSECVPADEACGEGTVLVGSECVPGDAACGPGSVLVDGVCTVVPVLSHFAVAVAPIDCDSIVSGRAIDLTVTAIDTAGQPLTTYDGSVDLHGVGVAVTPATLSGFVGGVASAPVEVEGVGSAARISVADPVDGAGGTSSTFPVVAEVLTPTASVASGPVRAGASFDLTITLASNACDTPDFDGTAALTSLVPGATVTPANEVLSGVGPYVVAVRVDAAFVSQQTVGIEVDVDGVTDTVDVDVAPRIAFDGVQYAWGLATDGRATWQPAGGGTGAFTYDVFVATDPGEQDFEAAPAATTTGTSVTLPGLAPGVTRYVVVRARDGIDDGDDANTVEASLLTGEVLFVDDDNAGGTEDGGASTPFSTLGQALVAWEARAGTGSPVRSILLAEGDYPELPLLLDRGERLLGGFLPGPTPASWEAGGSPSVLTHPDGVVGAPAVFVDSDDVLLDGFEFPADLDGSYDLVRVEGASGVALRNLTLATPSELALNLSGSEVAVTNVTAPCPTDRPLPKALGAVDSTVTVDGFLTQDCWVAVQVHASSAVLRGLDVSRSDLGVTASGSTVVVEDSHLYDVESGLEGNLNDLTLQGSNAIDAHGRCLYLDEAVATSITGGTFDCGFTGVFHRTGSDGGDFLLDSVDIRSDSLAFEVHHEGAPTEPGFVHVVESTFESDGALISVDHATAGEPVEVGFLYDTFDLDRGGVEISGRREADLLVIVGRTTFRGGRQAQLQVDDGTVLGGATGVVENVFEHGETAFKAYLLRDGAEPHLVFQANTVTDANQAVFVTGQSDSGRPHVTVAGNTVRDAGGGVGLLLPLQSGSAWASVTGNDFEQVDSPVFLDASVVDGEGWFEIADNEALGAVDGAWVGTHANDGRMRLDVRDNDFGAGDPFGTGILVGPRVGQGTHVVNVRGNTVEGSGTGIRVLPVTERSGVLPLDLRDNRVEGIGDVGLVVESGDGGDPSEAPFAGALVAGNTVLGTGATGLGVFRHVASDAVVTSLVVDNDVRDAQGIGFDLGGSGSGRARALTAEGNRAWNAGGVAIAWADSQTDGTRARLIGNDVAGARSAGIAAGLHDSSDGRLEIRGNTVTAGGGIVASLPSSTNGSRLFVSHNQLVSAPGHEATIRVDAGPGVGDGNTFEVVNNTLWSAEERGVWATCPDDPGCRGAVVNNLIGLVDGVSLSTSGTSVTTGYNLLDADEALIDVDTNFVAAPTFGNPADAVVTVTDVDVDARTFVQDGPGSLQVGDTVVVHGEGVVREVVSVTGGALPWLEVVEVDGPPLDVLGEAAVVFGWHPADFVSADVDYGLAAGSRGIDEGDPGLLDDADGSRSDVGHTGGHTGAVGSVQDCLATCTDRQDAAYAACPEGGLPICNAEPFACDQSAAAALDACRWQADVDLSTCTAACALGLSEPRVHLPFDGDLSNVGSLGGTATGAPGGYAPDRCGRTDGAGSFATHSVVTPAVNLSGGDVTFAVWIRTSDVTGSDGVLAHPSSGGNLLLQIGRFSANYTVELYWPGTPSILTFGAASDDAWHHLVTTVDATAGVHRAYLDGVEVAQKTGVTPTTAVRNTSIYVGRLRDIAGSYTGLIDDVRVYDVALSPEEVETLYAFESTVCP